MLQSFKIYNHPLDKLSSQSKILISTINAHCHNIAHSDPEYYNALIKSEVLIPDGISVVWAVRWLTGEKLKKIDRKSVV